MNADPVRRLDSLRTLAAGLATALVCLVLAGGSPVPPLTVKEGAAGGIQGLADLPRPPDGPSWAPRPVTSGGLRMLAAADPTGFTLYTAGGAVSFLPGVNLGSTTPGHQPGELAMTAEHYRAWFAAMSWLGVRAVRVYTIHPPAFYTELAAYNLANRTRPIYLVQGVYLPDESYVEKRDLYDPAVTASFTDELRDASAAVSGDLIRPPTQGRASGSWTADVGPWLAAWIIGVEWDPVATAASDARNAAAPMRYGRYFGNGPAASPTERWLAGRMDELATAEAERGRTMPIAFVNWPTTDPLPHPDEPLASEDAVGIEANNIRPTPAWPGGTFASYHAYPYYPDFQRHEAALRQFQYGGRADPYAGYLNQLRRHHTDMPVMVSEFGVPSSLGSAHDGPLGRSQGNHSEQEAMEIDAELIRLVHDLGLAGGFLFSWSDEWFKFTWNTIAHQVPGARRQLWHDPLTNEQHFGLLATDPLGAPDAEPVTLSDDGERAVSAWADESYVHLRLRHAGPLPSKLTIGLDVLPALTGPPAPGSKGPRADAAFALDLAGDTGQAWIRTELDPLPLDASIPAEQRPGVPGWARFQLIANREATVPSTKLRLPVALFDAGVLRPGSWDPADPAADSRALWQVRGGDVEVRVPWAMAGFADPSGHRVLTPRGGVAATEVSPGIGLTLSTGTGEDKFVGEVRWANWNQVRYAERLKRGARAVRDAFVDTAAAG